jgi:hypothetical protein
MIYQMTMLPETNPHCPDRELLQADSERIIPGMGQAQYPATLW